MLIHQKVSSKHLELETDLYIIRPEVVKEEEVSILYLLHGYWGDYSNWIRYTRIEKYVADKNMIVVMPSGLNMFYVDADSWYSYFKYLTEELPAIIKETYRLNIERENTFIAGLSMGGYGAMRAILSTDIYSKGASFSGALDVFKLQSSVYDKRKGPFKTLFSDKFKKEDDLYHLLTLQKDKDISLYVSCGTEDVLLPHNRGFHELLKQKKIKHVYYEKPGNHTWDFWDQEIKEALKFFLEK
ncbi:MAG: tributyrin esterase [Acholeplasmataceae bacterium]|jgi:S-formylglutathione hydrolase FrmB|nr:tributyrin esterase [Acholeplasmataceae bacterium]